MSSYKDILCKNLRKAIDEDEKARAYRHQYYLYDNPAVPVECFVCKQSFLEIYNFRYSICTENYEDVFIRWIIQREAVCRVCLNSRMAEEEYQKQLEEYEAAELAKRVACVECGEKVNPEDILMSRSDCELLPVCMAKCYKKVYPYGIEPMDYDLLFGKYDNSRGMEDSHLAEDEIYRRFICDVATGRFESPEKMMEMAQKIKNLIDDRANCGRWYA
jgi:ribosomal protein L24E